MSGVLSGINAWDTSGPADEIAAGATALGAIFPTGDNAADLGRAANQWRTGYFGTSLVLPQGGMLALGASVAGVSGEHFISTTPGEIDTWAGDVLVWKATSIYNIALVGIRPSGANRDLGTAGFAWRSGYFATSIVLGGYLQITEMSAPGAGAANTCRLYTVDNGGKTELYAQFQTGGGVQVAVEA